MLDDKPSTVRNSAKAIDGRRTGAQAYNDKQEELRKIGRQLYPQRLRRAYEMVVAALVNSPEEEEKLLVLVVERELSQLDTVDLAYEAGAHHKTGQDMRLEAKAEVDAEIVGEFGEQVYERVLQMEDYRTHLLTIGNALHPWMKELGTELRNEQVMPLAVIMKSASVDTRGHPPAAWSVRILEQSRSILTPAQHAALAHALSSYIAGRR